MKMNNKEKLRRLIIEAIHPECESYTKAIRKYGVATGDYRVKSDGSRGSEIISYDINLDRVLQAISVKFKYENGEMKFINIDEGGYVNYKGHPEYNSYETICRWKLNKELSEQEPETIDALLKLFEPNEKTKFQ